jgi:hypothetical protein
MITLEAKADAIKTAIQRYGLISNSHADRDFIISALAGKLTEDEIRSAMFTLYLALEFAEEAVKIRPIAADLDLMCDVLAFKQGRI